MFRKLMNWSWQNNGKLWRWLSSQRFLVILLVFPFWMYVFIINLGIWAGAVFMIGPVGFMFMAINGILFKTRGALAQWSANSGIMGKVVFGPLWAATSVLYGASRAIEMVITIEDTVKSLSE